MVPCPFTLSSISLFHFSLLFPPISSLLLPLVSVCTFPNRSLILKLAVRGVLWSLQWVWSESSGSGRSPVGLVRARPTNGFSSILSWKPRFLLYYIVRFPAITHAPWYDISVSYFSELTEPTRKVPVWITVPDRPTSSSANHQQLSKQARKTFVDGVKLKETSQRRRTTFVMSALFHTDRQDRTGRVAWRRAIVVRRYDRDTYDTGWDRSTSGDRLVCFHSFHRVGRRVRVVDSYVEHNTENELDFIYQKYVLYRFLDLKALMYENRTQNYETNSWKNIPRTLLSICYVVSKPCCADYSILSYTHNKLKDNNLLWP